MRAEFLRVLCLCSNTLRHIDLRVRYGEAMVGAASLPIRIDSRSAIPPYEQLRAQLSLLVAAGRLRPGTRLPTIRELAAQTELAPNTVARAYRELERACIVSTRGRAGSFVASEPPVAFEVVERAERLREAARTFAMETRQLAIQSGEALEAVVAALREGDEVSGPDPLDDPVGYLPSPTD